MNYDKKLAVQSLQIIWQCIIVVFDLLGAATI